MKHEKITIDDLKIDASVKLFLKDCISNNEFPNMLLYGNPGTGKTTTTTVLIDTYFSSKPLISQQDKKRNVLAMNASIYRNTYEFVNTIKGFSESCNISGNNKRFVLLDEIDYMTIHGQKSLIVLMKQFEDIVFVCMCNYLSKLIDELKCYFLVFNYNCFGSLVNQYINEQNNSDTTTLLNYILCDSDIREYNNEKRRLSYLEPSILNNIVIFFKTTVDKLYNTMVMCENDIKNDDIDSKALADVSQLIGIQEDKLKSILYQNAFDRLTEDDYNKCNTDNIILLIESIL